MQCYKNKSEYVLKYVHDFVNNINETWTHNIKNKHWNLNGKKVILTLLYWKMYSTKLIMYNIVYII